MLPPVLSADIPVIPEIPVSFWQWLKGFHYGELTPYLDEEGILNVSVTDYTWKA